MSTYNNFTVDMLESSKIELVEAILLTHSLKEYYQVDIDIIEKVLKQKKLENKIKTF